MEPDPMARVAFGRPRYHWRPCLSNSLYFWFGVVLLEPISYVLYIVYTTYNCMHFGDCTFSSARGSIKIAKCELRIMHTSFREIMLNPDWLWWVNLAFSRVIIYSVPWKFNENAAVLNTLTHSKNIGRRLCRHFAMCHSKIIQDNLVLKDPRLENSVTG